VISVNHLYKEMSKYFGPQGWWPTTPAGQTKPVYKKRKSQSLNEREKLEICIGAYLTQNTSWTNVEKAIAQLNKAKIFSITDLNKLSEKKLSKLIYSCGYYNQKTKRLKLFAKYVLRKYSGNLSNMFKKPLAELRAELLSLKGIGNETADSILLYAANKPSFVIDAYTIRIAGRFGIIKSRDYMEVQKFFVDRVKQSVPVYKEFHSFFVNLAKDFCNKKPKCKICPLTKKCPKRI
jgi:endonuclease III related protein